MKKFELKVDYKDNRGEIIDLLIGEKIDAVTYINFKRGAIRGNHFHKKTVQWGYVVKGELSVTSKKPNGKITQMVVRKGDLFVDEKMEGHAIKALKESEVLFFTRGPRAGKEYISDTYHLKNPLI